MNILLVKLSAIGDVVHTLPSLAVLRKLHPRAHITWVIEEAASDLIKNHPCLDRVIISRRKTWLREIGRGRLEAIREVRQFIGDLRSRSYDMVIDFHGLFKSGVIVALSRARRKIGYRSMQEMSGLFLNEKVPEDMNKHAVDRYLDLVRHAGAGDFARPLSEEEEKHCRKVEFLIPLGEQEERKIAELRNAKGLKGKFVALNPVALWETKLWKDESLARLADRIVKDLHLPVVFTGSGMREILSIQGLMKTDSISMAGETSLRELACLYRHAAAVVTTDSGPMHIAAAVGTPVVALFGPTDPLRTGPYGEGHRVIRSKLPCSPCFLKKCSTRECMNRIGVEEVYQALEAVICRTQADSMGITSSKREKFGSSE